MYALLGIDAVLRITAALVVLFVAVPALARRRPASLDRLQWFWWCLAAGITALTLLGQLATLVNALSAPTLILVIAVVIVLVRAHTSGRLPAVLLRDWYRGLVRVSLHTLEGRVSIRRRVRRRIRRTRAALASTSPAERRHAIAWFVLIAVAAAFRFYRPFVTANLGFSDTYVHLYLVRLLEEGRQVDPAWGPYPRGMHFLLMAIRELTNVDANMLLNFFGAAVGVLMTLSVADTARRLARNFTAGIVAGLLFATMIGGGAQYFLLGGSIATDRAAEAREFLGLAYDQIPATRGEFDVLLTVFQRQTATLPQELAMVLLFPAAMFLFMYIRQREGWWWSITGYFLCTSAIAATHPGVAVPLVLLSLVTVIAARASLRDVRNAILAGLGGLVLGSTWMLGFIAYPPNPTRTGGAAAYYFPFLRNAADAQIVTWVEVTPFVIACAVIALALLVRSVFMKERQAAYVWTSLAVLLFTFTHFASRYGWPEIVEVRRNASWLAMAIAILLGVASVELLRTRATKVLAILLGALWLWRVPIAGANEKLINFSGYNATAYAVLEIQREYEPFTWTMVTYGQEFPMVLGKGFHIPAVDFLERYDPVAAKLQIPTPYVFIAVEKKAHPFQINTWAAHFSREDIQRRLQTWCFLYERTHKDMRIFLDDENVRVYVIHRPVEAVPR